MTLYRIFQPDGPFRFSELTGAKSVTERAGPADVPHPYITHGEWYCRNTDCPVREVRIEAKWLNCRKPETPRFHCPRCRGELAFHSNLKTTTLVPLGGEESE